MTNRQKIVAIDRNMPIQEALLFSIENSFSRYPVYEEDIDSIVGVLHLKDLIAAYLKMPEQPVSVIAEEAMFIHPTYDISKLLKKMQKEKIHMAVVIDEYGQTEGIVTMEDIIEEIVGNILDEHDEEETVIKRIAQDSYVVEGLLPLEQVEELFSDLKFPEGEIETLNGFLLCELGRLPEEGEKIEINYQGYQFIPVEIKDKMIQLVKITRSKNAEPEGKEDKE
jgi:putative hemolysin